MNVSVRVGAGLVLGAGITRFSITLTDGATAADLLEYLRAQYPAVSRLESVVLVSNGEHMSSSATLSEGQEIALLLPISGGRK